MVHMSYAQWACLPSTYRNKVNPGSKAAQQGVREGDLISSINGKSTRDLTNSEAHALLRNAGDHLKLGLNQENGSPKRRIYKSSLQESTSTETLKKTTKSVTLNTRIISTLPKKNGVDDTNADQNYVNQNGGLKKSSPDQQIDTEKKSTKINNETRASAENRHTIKSLDYSTGAEVGNKRMPCGSRNRRNRRNRNRKRFQQPLTPLEDSSNKEDQEGDQSSEIEISTDKNDATQIQENSDNILKNGEDLAEAKINGNAVKVTTESLPLDGLPCKDNMSITRWRPRRNKFQLEKKVLDTGTKICEITTISNSPLEAKLDHITGVGILESGHTKSENLLTSMTVSEPLEPVKPLSSKVANKVETLGDQRFALAILANKGHSLDIHEVSDSDIETDNSRHAIIVEAESDVERELLGERSNSEESSTDKPETEEESEANISQEDEIKLRNFIEGLRLPSSQSIKEDQESQKLESQKLELEMPQRKVKKRPALESYYSETQESNRFLEIIQEEGEKLSDDEQHIRDFINEEISKFRRDDYDQRKRQKMKYGDLVIEKCVRDEGNEKALNVTNDMGEERKISVTKSERKTESVEEKIPDEKGLATSNSSEDVEQKLFNGNLDPKKDYISDKGINTTSLEPSSKLSSQDFISSAEIMQPVQNHLHHPHKNLFLPYHHFGQQSFYDPRYNYPFQIFTSLIQDNIVNNMYGSRSPPTPPKRTVSFGTEPEPHRPPTPPEIDYPLPEVPPLPNRRGRFIGPPPTPPIRQKSMLSLIPQKYISNE